MIHYKIYKSVYDTILRGEKTIEFRLLNEKSSRIKVKDKICFHVVEDESLKLNVVVTGITMFSSIDDLWEHKEFLQKNTLNMSKEELRKEFNKIFGKENVDNSELIGIHFVLMNELNVD